MHHHFVRGPSRFLWFLIGAGTATWYVKSREMASHGGPCWRAPIRERPQNPDWAFSERRWEEDSEKLKDAVTDASEATLDSIVSAAQTLKKRLADHRSERRLRPETPEQTSEDPKFPPMP